MTSETTVADGEALAARPVPLRPDLVSQDECGLYQRTLERAGRRWSGPILYAGVAGARRFVEYRRYVRGISDRVLTQRLRELERQKLMVREVVPTMPVQILYTPTPAGAQLVAALRPLAEWGLEHPELLDPAPEP